MFSVTGISIGNNKVQQLSGLFSIHYRLHLMELFFLIIESSEQRSGNTKAEINMITIIMHQRQIVQHDCLVESEGLY